MVRRWKETTKVKGKKERNESQEKKYRRAGKGEGIYTLPVTRYRYSHIQ